MSEPRYVLIDAKNLFDLAVAVHEFMDDVPRYEPTGGPVHDIDGTPGGTWYQAVYWKEME